MYGQVMKQFVADIKPLDRKTGGYFFKTKSSTLANIKLVWGVDTKYRILFFNNDLSSVCINGCPAFQKDRRIIEESPRRLIPSPSSAGSFQMGATAFSPLSSPPSYSILQINPLL